MTAWHIVAETGFAAFGGFACVVIVRDVKRAVRTWRRLREMERDTLNG